MAGPGAKTDSRMVRIQLPLPPALLAAIDQRRGGQARTAFIRQVLQGALLHADTPLEPAPPVAAVPVRLVPQQAPPDPAHRHRPSGQVAASRYKGAELWETPLCQCGAVLAERRIPTV